jgi:hypothetical protein
LDAVCGGVGELAVDVTADRRSERSMITDRRIVLRNDSDVACMASAGERGSVLR